MGVAYRVPLLVAGFLSLGFGVAAGLARLGFGIEFPAPALLRVALPYHAAFYLPLVLLHATLAARIAGDLLALPLLRAAGAAGNAAALAFFFVTMLVTGIRGTRASAPPCPV